MMKLIKKSSYGVFIVMIMIITRETSISQSTDYPDPVTNPQSPIMLSGDWIPENPHKIDFSALPCILSEHSIVSDVRYAWGKISPKVNSVTLQLPGEKTVQSISLTLVTGEKLNIFI